MARRRLIAALAVTVGGAAPATPHYDARLMLDPARARLVVATEITGLACRGRSLRLYLNRALTIDYAAVDEVETKPLLDPPGAARFWLSSARAFDLPCPKRALILAYSGPGALTADGRNQVSPRLVELSLYGGWLPLARIDDRYRWRLRTSLPPGWTIASNGKAGAAITAV